QIFRTFYILLVILLVVLKLKVYRMNIMNSSVLSKLPNKAARHRLFGSVHPGPRTKPTTKSDMADIQNSKKDFLFDIKQVGISNVKYPIIVESALEPHTQQTIGT